MKQIREANAKWREHLNGTITIENPKRCAKKNEDIRKKAKQMMKDLLLICQKMSKRDRVRIFHDPKIWDSVIVPFVNEIHNNTLLGLSPDMDKTKKLVEVHNIARGCLIYYVPCNIEDMLRDDRKGTYARSHTKVALRTEMLKINGYDLNNKDNPKNKKIMEHVDKVWESQIERKE